MSAPKLRTAHRAPTPTEAKSLHVWQRVVRAIDAQRRRNSLQNLDRGNRLRALAQESFFENEDKARGPRIPDQLPYKGLD